MLHARLVAELRAILRDLTRKCNGTVLAAGTSHRNGQLAFALLDVQRQCILQKALIPLEQFLRFRVAHDKIHHILIKAGLMLEFRHVEGVGQAAHIQHKVCLRRDAVKLDAFLAAVFANAEGPISVKTRLGVEKPEEFTAILDIYNRYPICELTIHPRVMRQLYRGQADRAAFAAALPGCRMPVCYNGDVTTAADLHTLEAQYPQLSGIMVGRGIIADPALFREARGGAPAAREELRGYLDDLYHGYSELFGSAGCAVSRMKGHWFYLIHKFEGAEKLEKQLRKVREPWEYEVVVNQIFTLPFRP